jgi:hypothetical protein
MLDILNKASKALNSKKHMLIIFCDLKKAFDTCDVDVLLRKLGRLGVGGEGAGLVQELFIGAYTICIY